MCHIYRPLTRIFNKSNAHGQQLVNLVVGQVVNRLLGQNKNSGISVKLPTRNTHIGFGVDK